MLKLRTKLQVVPKDAKGTKALCVRQKLSRCYHKLCDFSIHALDRAHGAALGQAKGIVAMHGCQLKLGHVSSEKRRVPVNEAVPAKRYSKYYVKATKALKIQLSQSTYRQRDG